MQEWAKCRKRNIGFRKLTEESGNEWQKTLISKSLTKQLLAVFEKITVNVHKKAKNGNVTF